MARACTLPTFLDARIVNALRPEAARRGVSAVARGPRGFLRHLDDVDERWCAKRAGFVKRHMAQVKRRREPLFDASGAPTRRHLALAMWAYSPAPKRLAAWAARQRR